MTFQGSPQQNRRKSRAQLWIAVPSYPQSVSVSQGYPRQTSNVVSRLSKEVTGKPYEGNPWRKNTSVKPTFYRCVFS